MRNTRIRTAMVLALALAGVGLPSCRETRGLPAAVPETAWLPPPPLEDEVRLAAFGDWGVGGHRQAELLDAVEMVAAEVGGLHGGLLLGDNFYPRGVTSAEDPLWTERFTLPFGRPHLGRLTWYAVLGNHDYRRNPQAQIDYTRNSGGRWAMPGHYYRVDFTPEGIAPLLSVLAVDTQPREEGWAEQQAWLEQQLAQLATAPWATVVIGHHTVISHSYHQDARWPPDDFRALLARYRPAAYLCGHDHVLQMIERGGVGYAVLGTGVRSLYPTWQGRDSLFALSDRGFGLLRVTRGTVSLEFRDFDGEVLFVWETVIPIGRQGRAPEEATALASSPGASRRRPEASGGIPASGG